METDAQTVEMRSEPGESVASPLAGHQLSSLLATATGDRGICTSRGRLERLWGISDCPSQVGPKLEVWIK